MAEDTITIAVIEGTKREKRQSMHAAKFVAELGRKQEGVEIILVDPGDYNFSDQGESTEGKDPRYAEIVAKADAFFIVTPEYNHSFPGHLKRMLDSEYENYFYKPVSVAGVSSGDWGGVRAVEALLPVMHSLGLLTLHHNSYFRRIQDVFDEDGAIKSEHYERYTKSVTGQYKELIWAAKTLKWGRENLPR